MAAPFNNQDQADQLLGKGFITPEQAMRSKLALQLNVSENELPQDAIVQTDYGPMPSDDSVYKVKQKENADTLALNQAKNFASGRPNNLGLSVGPLSIDYNNLPKPSIPTEVINTQAAPVVEAAPVVAPAAPLSGFDIQTAGITQGALAAQQQALNDQKAYADIVTEQKKIEDARKSKEDDALTAANAMRTKQDAAIAELAATKISPDNYWANKSTGQKIGIGIAMIMGAFGAAKTGVNSAADVINKAIDQDLDTQKANYAAKKGAVGEMDSAYAKLHGVYKDELAATSAAKAELLNQAMIKIQSNAAKFKGDTATAAATNALGQLQTLKDAETLKLQQSKAYGEDPQFAGMDDKTRERYIPKSDIPFMPFGVASLGSKEDVSKFRAESVDIADAIDSLKKLQDMGDLSSLEKFSPAQEALSEELRQTTIGKLRTAILGPGIINEQERAIMERIVADPLKFLSFNSRNMASLSALRNSLTSSVNRKGMALGLKSAAPAGFEKEK